ncbi:MAG: WYL domain-containing protein [Clostridia bacterium]|nr:WYL domain-containing protein [Clostridia bacterium]
MFDILTKYSDEEHPLNAAEIVRYLEEKGISAERKSVYDDIAALEYYGCDIIKTDTPKVGWFIGERAFEIPEIFLLSDAVRSAKFISAKKTRELLSKLNGMLSVNQAKRREKGVYFSVAVKSGNEEIYYNIDKISRAIEDKRQIKIKYYQRRFDSNRQVSQSIKEMTLNPYALCWQDDHYYLIGNHIKYDNLIHLRLDRIRGVEVLEGTARHFSEVSEYKDCFDTSDYVDKLFGMYSGESEKIELWCSTQISEQLIDRFGEDIHITKSSKDGFHLSVNAVISDALVTWIINYGDCLRVIKPTRLIEMVKERAEKILERYK